MNSKQLHLAQLPEAISNAIMNSQSVPLLGLDIVFRGKWTIERSMEIKEDIFIYKGCFWKHIKSRDRYQQEDEYINDRTLREVHAVHKRIISYE